MKRAASTCLLVGVATVATVATRPAQAHAVGLSVGSYVVRGDHVDASITLARADLAAAVSGLDRDRDGTIDERELDDGRVAVADWFDHGIAVEADGHACAPSLERATLAPPDGVDVGIRYACAASPTRLRVAWTRLDVLPRAHRHAAHVELGPVVADDVLYAGHDALEVTAAGAAPKAPGALGWLRMGIEHIATGYDHLAFVFGVVLAGAGLRSVALAITAFTAAHSITLALATLGVWSPPARWVEVAIAASIIWIGLENVRVRAAASRWRLTFFFGLVHGFGFASALRDAGLPHAKVPLALLCFNLGVEVGQLAVVAVTLPALAYARRRGWLDPRATRALGLAVAMAGCVWLVARLVA